ncbi:CMT1A duplicated region transcript 1 protein [Echeneis naucrates]|uniref:CMT1A duplicated region transcript 1 protein n=1 Tax=Echeneis naucrates TaxID=173247 RepID=UPI001113A215|nr:CMT1A duplicated region transcript 1 protein [Echeneis naucrates]
MEAKSVELSSCVCGVCPRCVFGPPGPPRRLWPVSDEFRRRFMVRLLLRCESVHVLEHVHNVLGVTSWTLFAYARSARPVSPERCRLRSARGARDGKQPDPDPDLNAARIWDWFSRSPDWMKSDYLCRLFSLCEPELLRLVSNLSSVLLVRHKRGFLQLSSSSCHTKPSDKDSDDPALMVVPGSSKSVSGVSLYRDFIGCLPVNLSKRILGLLEECTLKHCQKVSRHWQHLAKETMAERKFRGNLQDQIKAMMKKYKGINIISPTYSGIVEVLVPAKDDERPDNPFSVQKVKPFEAAYAKIKTKTVQMEERNVYCGAYFTKALLSKKDPHRVVDYGGRSFMATGSKDRTVHLFYVASETKAVSVMKGHVGGVRAVLLCEDRGLVITAGSDASIRCWSLKTDRCEMVLYGHTGTVNCLDVHADRLVSGAKDCLVKVWNLQTGNHLEDFNFKHPKSIQCVKITTTQIYSSCERGLVKIWDLEKASLLRVIDAHRKSVKCLFFDDWHLLSGDLNGQVMAWSVRCDTKECLMTFNHPKEVRSLTLIYLRVVTGCVDGKIRIFNFLTGDCLRDITAEPETGRLLSLHFHDNSILVNTETSVKLYQFAKVFWDCTEAAGRGQGDVLPHEGLVSEKSAALLRKFPRTTFGVDHKAQVALPSRKMQNRDSKKPESAELHYHTRFLFTSSKCQVKEHCESVMLSEKAASERMKKRGLHHPLTRDSILLRVGAIQRAQCKDEVSVNMECNARLRDSWGPRPPQDPLQTQTCPPPHPHGSHHRRARTCVPILKRGASQNMTNTDVAASPDTTRRNSHFLFSKETQPQTAVTQSVISRDRVFSTSSKKGSGAPACMLSRSLPNLERCMKICTGLPKINP